jgi:hypothetical protein
MHYGKAVDWDADPAHRMDMLGFPKARLILEVQRQFLSFLGKTVETILVSTSLNTLTISMQWDMVAAHWLQSR